MFAESSLAKHPKGTTANLLLSQHSAAEQPKVRQGTGLSRKAIPVIGGNPKSLQIVWAKAAKRG